MSNYTGVYDPIALFDGRSWKKLNIGKKKNYEIFFLVLVSSRLLSDAARARPVRFD